MNMNRDELLGKIATARAFLESTDLTKETREKAEIRHEELYAAYQKLDEQEKKPEPDERVRGYIEEIRNILNKAKSG